MNDGDVLSHLSDVYDVLMENGCYVIGVHVTDYDETETAEEIWEKERENVKVKAVIQTEPADKTTRTEQVSKNMKLYSIETSF